MEVLRFSPAILVAAVAFLTGCAGVRDTTRTFDTVVIDAGHGGHDRGAPSRVGAPEKMKALDTALRLDAKLRSAGFRTVLTRGSDRFIPLGERARILNRQENAIFVSVHYNSSRNRGARGTETYYHSPVARRLAQKVESKLAGIPGNTTRGAKSARFYVLRNARYPAILVEGGFLSNRAEAVRASSGNYRDEVAERVATALIEQRFGRWKAAARLAAMRGDSRNGG